MNPFPDLYNNMQTPPTPSMFGDVNTNTAFIPNSFPTPIVDNNSADLIGNWPSLSETDLLAAAGVAGTGTNIPMSSPFTNTSSPAGTVPNMMDNQQAQMVMMMMQQQQEQQQQQQMLLRQQQQQQQQLLMQKRAAAQAQAQAQAMNQQQQQPPPWFLKQQQTKMMAAQTQQTQQVPSPNNSYSVSNSSSPMHVHQQSPLLNMDQQSQQSPAVQANIMNQSAVGTPILPSSSVASPNIVTDTADLALLAKRVEVILTLNQELIRLCLEHQQMNGNELREPNLTAYQGKLQSNLTYLATMADISMTKLEDNFKIPSPPDLTPLPPPYTLTGQRIHKLLGTAIRLFPPSAAQPAQPPNKRLNSNTAELDMSPYPQQQQQQQLQRAKQQQYQQQMQQQQHMMMMRQQQYMLIKQQQQQQQNGGANSMSSPQFLNQQQLGLSGPIVDNNSDMMTSMNMNNGGQPSNYSSPSSTSNNLGMDDMTMMMMYNNNN